MPSYPLQDVCLAVIIGTPLLASLFVGLRIYARKKIATALGWDDYTIILAMLLSFALIYPSYRFTKMWHFGIHIWQVNQHKLEPDYDEYHIVLKSFNLLNTPILPLAKASIIILLLRVSKVLTWMRRTLYVILFFNLGACIIPWVILIFQCPPLTGNTWGPRVFGNLQCMGRIKIGQMTIFITCANLLTDLLIFPIPILLMRKLETTRFRTKLIIAFLFTTTLGVTAIGGGKIFLTYKDRLYRSYSDDWTYSINFCINHVENNVAIIVACIPALRGLIMQWVSGGRQTASGYDEERPRYGAGRPLRRWPSDRARREWDISVGAMTGSTTVTIEGGWATRKGKEDSFDNSLSKSIGSDTTLGPEPLISITEAERSYHFTSMMREIDEMEFITVKSGILERNSADNRSAHSLHSVRRSVDIITP